MTYYLICSINGYQVLTKTLETLSKADAAYFDS